MSANAHRLSQRPSLTPTSLLIRLGDEETAAPGWCGAIRRTGGALLSLSSSAIAHGTFDAGGQGTNSCWPEL